MSAPERHLSGSEYQVLRDFLSREFGLFFEESKVTLLENRIVPLLTEFECADVNSLIDKIMHDEPRRNRLLDAVTTNETWFFRHPVHFDILRDEVLPPMFEEKRRAGNRTLSVWSAGCSIGAEAYSLAIVILELLGAEAPQWRIDIFGSDISSQALARARQAQYSSSETRLISNLLLNKYFSTVTPGTFVVRPEHRELIQFEQLNLLDPWPERTFDIIFCRNTMIYFKEKTKAALTERFYHALAPDGAFFVSATETLHWKEGFSSQFIKQEYVYRRPSVQREYALFRFQTPSDLLRALNLVVRHRLNYRLQPDQVTDPSRPKKALKVEKMLEKQLHRLLAEANLSAREVEILKE